MRSPLSFLQTKQAQLPQSLLSREMLRTPPHLRDLPLDPLWQLRVFLTLRSSGLDREPRGSSAAPAGLCPVPGLRLLRASRGRCRPAGAALPPRFPGLGHGGGRQEGRVSGAEGSGAGGGGLGGVGWVAVRWG